MQLDPKAMSAAREAWIASDVSTRFFSDVEHCALEAAIRAYLSSAIPGEVAELVERLRGTIFAEPAESQRLRLVADEAATALTSLAARVEALEAGLEPFAVRAGKLDGKWLDHETHWSPAYGSTEITIGDLRRARLLLKKDSKA